MGCLGPLRLGALGLPGPLSKTALNKYLIFNRKCGEKKTIFNHMPNDKLHNHNCFIMPNSIRSILSETRSVTRSTTFSGADNVSKTTYKFCGCASNMWGKKLHSFIFAIALSELHLSWKFLPNVYFNKFPIICVFHILYIFRDGEPA